MKYTAWFTLAFLSLVCACGRTTTTPSPVVVTESTEAEPGPEVPYPQYENWSQFEVGTQVVRRKEVTNPNGTVIETETLRLAEKSAEKVVVESQTFVERSSGKNDDNPPQNFVFPAKFRLPANMEIAQFSLPSMKAKQTGEEKVSVADVEYDAKVFEWTEVNEAGPMKVKLLWCEAFPGSKIRQVMNTEQTGTNSVEEIVKAEIKKS